MNLTATNLTTTNLTTNGIRGHGGCGLLHVEKSGRTPPVNSRGVKHLNQITVHRENRVEQKSKLKRNFAKPIWCGNRTRKLDIRFRHR